MHNCNNFALAKVKNGCSIILYSKYKNEEELKINNLKVALICKIIENRNQNINSIQADQR